jgi:heparan-alpha-glucosaminide N-acetyltransferase
MTNDNRISSIDIMRGLTLVLMLFVNDLYMPGVPSWLGHMNADFDGMGLADWVFPGFLFMVGMAIPFSINKRISAGDSTLDIAKHILKRSISLIIIGVLMLNSGRVNPEFTGLSKNMWALLMYVGVFLVWNKYPEKENNFFTVTSLKLLGLALLIVLVFKFRSGEFENGGSLITSWWGILGLIGWGYMVAALIYLGIKDSILNTIIAFLFFLALNILSKLGYMSYLDGIKPIFGVITEGNVPMIVISGMLVSLLLKKYRADEEIKGVAIIVAIGVTSLTAGFILRNWFIISKIQATPSWGLICIGITMILFALVYWIVDIRKITRWSSFLKPAGENSLTTYLAPDILYYLIWSTGVPVLFYKQSGMPLVVIAGSLVWALLMIGFCALLVRNKIKLKL